MVQWERLGFVRPGFPVCKMGDFFIHFLAETLEAQHTVGLLSVGFRGSVTDSLPARFHCFLSP